MQTTLRIDDAIYREAKSEAAREGISLTRLVEGALCLRLRRVPAGKMSLPTYDSGVRLPAGFDLGSVVREAETAYGSRLAARSAPCGRQARVRRS